MNKKLNRLIEDEEITMAKIEELQKHLKDVRAARKQEALLELLEGIQDGRVVVEPIPDSEPDVTKLEGNQREDKTNESNKNGAEVAPESEENHE